MGLKPTNLFVGSSPKNVDQWWSKLLNRETPPGGTVRLLLKRVDPDLHKKQANKTKRILEQTTPSDTIKDIYTSKLAALGI